MKPINVFIAIGAITKTGTLATTFNKPAGEANPYVWFGYAPLKIYNHTTTLLLHFMINTLNNKNNITIILELIKYPVNHWFFTLIHTQLQRTKLTTR